MPNGDPDWGVKEYPKLESFFSRISDTLEEFADSYNLLIDKYYHQSPAWSFLFRHPKGGVGKMSVCKNGNDQVTIVPIWWLDDYDHYARFWKETEGKKSSLNKPELWKALSDTFKTIISWSKEDLSGKSDPVLKEMWHTECTKEEFEREAEKYPIPKLD